MAYGLSMVVGLSVDEQTTDGTMKLNLDIQTSDRKPLRIEMNQCKLRL
jgi:hypothetical protein